MMHDFGDGENIQFKDLSSQWFSYSCAMFHLLIYNRLMIFGHSICDHAGGY